MQQKVTPTSQLAEIFWLGRKLNENCSGFLRPRTEVWHNIAWGISVWWKTSTIFKLNDIVLTDQKIENIVRTCRNTHRKRNYNHQSEKLRQIIFRKHTKKAIIQSDLSWENWYLIITNYVLARFFTEYSTPYNNNVENDFSFFCLLRTGNCFFTTSVHTTSLCLIKRI